MPTYDAPQSDLNRAAMLNRALETASEAGGDDGRYIAAQTLEGLTGLAPKFTSATEALNATLSDRIKENKERVAEISQVARNVRDMWAVLKRRVVREKEPAEVLTYYALPLDGQTPRPTTSDAWLSLAGQLIAGDAKAVQGGHPAMANPSADDLGRALAQAQQEAADVPSADRAYDDAQAAVATLRPKADELLDDVMADLRYNLRKLDAPSQRRIMRSYGAQFSYLEGEPQDE